MAYRKILQGMDFCPFFIGIHQKTAVMQTTPTVKLTKPWTLLGAKRLVTIYQNTLHNLTNPILSWQNSRIYCNIHKNCKNTINHLKLSILDTHLSLYKYIKTTILMFFTLRLCKTTEICSSPTLVQKKKKISNGFSLSQQGRKINAEVLKVSKNY